MFLTYCALACMASGFAQQDTRTSSTFRDQRTKVVITLRSDPSKLPVNPDGTRKKVKQLNNPRLIETSLKQIEKTLEKYDPRLLRDSVSTIYLFEELDNDGAASDSYKDCVFLAAKNAGDLEPVLHYELAKILARSFGPKTTKLESEWQKLNPKDFSYEEDHAYAAKTNAELNEQGFWNADSTESFQKDYALVVRNLFTGNKQFWKAMQDCPRLAAKAELAIAYYRSLSKTYTPKWFVKLAGPVPGAGYDVNDWSVTVTSKSEITFGD